MHLTDEQQSIIQTELNVDSHPILLIYACAGSGKTVTLYEYAKRRPDLRKIYISYNRNVRQFAQNELFKDVKNIKHLTFDAICYHQYNDINTRENFVQSLLVDKLPINIKEKYQNNWSILNAALTTLEQFWNDETKELEDKHICIPNWQKKMIMEYKRKENCIIETEKQLKNVILQISKEIWEKIQEGIIPWSHASLRKRFYLENVQIQYDLILVDEAQDLTSVMLYSVLQQRNSKKIFVGDEYQQIYQFQGTTNTFKVLHVDAIRKKLSVTFRFGNQIASYANSIIQKCKQDPQFQIQCFNDIHNAENNKKDNKGQEHKLQTLLFRKNSTMLKQAQWIVKKMGENEKIFFQSDFDGLYEIVKRVYREKKENPKKFDRKYFSEDRDSHRMRIEQGSVVEFVRDNDDPLQEMDHIRIFIDKTNAKFILGTVHSVKGLEFDHVVLGEDLDLPTLKDVRNNIDFFNEEINILYTAITRAKKEVIFHPSLKNKMENMELFNPFQYECVQCNRSILNRGLCDSCKRNYNLCISCHHPFYMGVNKWKTLCKNCWPKKDHVDAISKKCPICDRSFVIDTKSSVCTNCIETKSNYCRLKKCETCDFVFFTGDDGGSNNHNNQWKKHCTFCWLPYENKTNDSKRIKLDEGFVKKEKSIRKPGKLSFIHIDN